MLSLELVAVVLTLLAVYLTVRQIIWCWPLAMVSVTLYAVVFYDARLYADMGVPSIYSSARTELAKLLIYGLFRKIRVLAQDGDGVHHHY